MTPLTFGQVLVVGERLAALGLKPAIPARDVICYVEEWTVDDVDSLPADRVVLEVDDEQGARPWVHVVARYPIAASTASQLVTVETFWSA